MFLQGDDNTYSTIIPQKMSRHYLNKIAFQNLKALKQVVFIPATNSSFPFDSTNLSLFYESPTVHLTLPFSILLQLLLLPLVIFLSQHKMPSLFYVSCRVPFVIVSPQFCQIIFFPFYLHTRFFPLDQATKFTPPY